MPVATAAGSAPPAGVSRVRSARSDGQLGEEEFYPDVLDRAAVQCLHQAPIEHPKLRNATKTFVVIAQAPGIGPTFSGQHNYGRTEAAVGRGVRLGTRIGHRA